MLSLVPKSLYPRLHGYCDAGLSRHEALQLISLEIVCEASAVGGRQIALAPLAEGVAGDHKFVLQEPAMVLAALARSEAPATA